MARMFTPEVLISASRRTIRPALAAGTLVAALVSALSATPALGSLEREFGLRWLFALRGPVSPPENIVLVTMGRNAAASIFLPRDPALYHRCIDVRIGSGSAVHQALPPIPARWPRCLHAMLIAKLQGANARVIAFDVLFRERPPQADLRGDVSLEQDVALGRAMAESGNVVIAQKIERTAADTASGEERLLTLSTKIEQAALGAAPFPVIPSAGRRIDSFLAFKEDGWATPSLPVLALQVYALDAYPAFRRQLAAASAEADALLPADIEALRRSGRLQATSLLLRQVFVRDPSLLERLTESSLQPGASPTEAQSRLPEILASVYGGPGSRLLNFFGPAGTIPAVGFDEVLAMPADSVSGIFAGKAVFVGYAEARQAEQVEHFGTVYSGADGTDLSGVEIAATAFANLLDNASLRPAPAGLSVLVAFLATLGAATLCLLLRNRIALPLTAALAAGYIAVTVQLFTSAHVWLPLFAPLALCIPAAIAFAIVWKYLDTRRQRDRVRQAFRMFVPGDVADELERNAGRIAATRRSLECICVATDAARFTTLAETMTPESVTDLLNEYFDALFRPVIMHRGFVSDVVADAMMALWPQEGIDARRAVCTALLEMRDAAEAFNRRALQNQMVTRFGAMCGRVSLATIGAHAHYEYRAVGDPVNTASRIQELNKILGTRVLVSGTLLAGVDGFLTRDLGKFLLRGKSTPEPIFELIETSERASAGQIALAADFAAAREILASGRSAEAITAFRALRARHSDDGPTAFYLAELLAGRAAAGAPLAAG